MLIGYGSSFVCLVFYGMPVLAWLKTWRGVVFGERNNGQAGGWGGGGVVVLVLGAGVVLCRE